MSDEGGAVGGPYPDKFVVGIDNAGTRFDGVDQPLSTRHLKGIFIALARQFD